MSPFGKVPVTEIVVSVPEPGLMLYLPGFPAEARPGALATILLASTPANETEIGLTTPL
ncbi:hypothetical protein D3C84_923360 [compost metagenome]